MMENNTTPYVCYQCGGTFLIPTRQGRLPKRCPDCKAVYKRFYMRAAQRRHRLRGQEEAVNAAQQA